jgi:DNA-binding LacI/PurR family transcriptional regulator
VATTDRQGEDAEARSGRVTARDVARAAGVSVAVVSYSFNRPNRVSSVTRERVLATAAALGYTGPDAAGRALRLGRRGAIALVSAEPLERLLADPAAVLVGRGLARVCDRAALAIILGPTSRGAADGAVHVGGGSLDAEPLPTVVVDGPSAPGVPRVTARTREGAAVVAAHLAGLGHRRLAVLARPYDAERLAGAREGWGAAGPVHAYEVTGPSRADGEIAARRALDAGADAVLGLTDRLALGALVAARQMGLVVPGDVSVAGMDDLPYSDAAGLTTVFVPYLPMGELAGDVLLDLLAGTPRTSPPPLPATLAVRSTSGPPRLTRPRS